MPARSQPRSVGLAIIGTGGMAHHHARMFRQVPGCRLRAACDIDLARAQSFCKEHNIPHATTQVEEILALPDIQAVSIVTPDATHTPLSLQCLAAGRHVLCEKPLALSHSDAARMVAAARRAGVVNMVNFSYRDWSALRGAARLVAEGGIGEVVHVEASYLQAWLVSSCWGNWRTDPAWLWRLSSRHGSKGVLGDIGVHILDFATHAAGPLAEVFCRLKSFPKAPRSRIGPYRLDANDSAVISTVFKNGALGTIHTTRWCGGHANRLFLKIAGTRGSVCIDSDLSTSAYRVCRGNDLATNTWREQKVSPHPGNYARFITAIRGGASAEPDFVRGAEIQKVLDACFQSSDEGRPVRVA